MTDNTRIYHLTHQLDNLIAAVRLGLSKNFLSWEARRGIVVHATVLKHGLTTPTAPETFEAVERFIADETARLK